MADITDDIRAALESKLALTINGSYDIAFENVSYSPTTGVSFLKTNFVPVARNPAVRGLNPRQLYTGIFTVSVFAAEGVGPGVANAIAKTVSEAFEATTTVSYTNTDDETIEVSILSAERRQGFVDTPWYYTPVVINWYIYK